MNLIRSLTKCLSKITALNIFLGIHIFFGKYSVNSYSKVTSLLTALYCMLIGAISVVLRLYYKNTFDKILHGSSFALPEFLIYIILYLYGRNNKFSLFYSRIKNIDVKMGLPEIPLVTTTWKYFALRAIILRILKAVMYFFLIHSLMPYCFTLFIVISNELTYAHRILILYILNDRMKLLKEKFIKDLKDSLCIGQNGMAIKITKLYDNLQIYDNLLDAFDGPNLHLQVSVSKRIFILFISVFPTNITTCFVSDINNNANELG